jgi:Na+/glutamate symporter
MSDMFFIALPIFTFCLFIGIIYFGMKAGINYSSENLKKDENDS